MSAGLTLTPVMAGALAELTEQGVVYPYNDHSLATMEALERRGLAVLQHFEPSHSYGTLGARGGTARGRWTRQWVAHPAGWTP